MKKIYFVFLLSILALELHAQIRNMHYSIASQGTLTSADRIPFWMDANQYGSVPLPGPSVSVLSEVSRDYHSSGKHLVDWGFSFEGRANLGKEAELFLIEGYAKAKLSIFEVKAGREKDMIGLVDSTLSSGSFAVSGNALGIPKVEFAIPEFYGLPILGKLFAVKGNFVHGWLGEVPVSFLNIPNQVNTFYHQKSLYGRIGKPAGKLKVYGGINHMVFWGNDDIIFGDNFPLSPKQTYMSVIIGRKVKSRYISKVGNQLGSIDIGSEIDFENIRLFIYRQNFYDKGALYYLANIRDGLNGISLTNKRINNNAFRWNKLLFELLYTKNQAGESWSKWTPSGPEQYYNHSVYIEGYSYKGMGVGTPFITPRHLAKKGFVSAPQDYFINNRVILFHLGMEASVQNWTFISKASYSENYGTYWTSAVKYFWFNNKRVPHTPVYGVFQKVNQFSIYLEGKREFKNGLNLGYTAAFDIGKLYDNAFGGMIEISKTFNPTPQHKRFTHGRQSGK